MKYGLFSDVHGNLEAFQVVLAELAGAGVDRYLFLGDLVGYGADARACVRLLKDLGARHDCLCIAGNHDFAVCGRTSYDHYSRSAQIAIEWTKKELDPADMDLLASFKLVAETEHCILAHANFVAPEQWDYIFDIDDAELNFKSFRQSLGFVGHSHKPVVFSSGAIVDWSICSDVCLKKNERYIINVGSVGQPRDGDPRASFAIYDQEAETVQIRRVAYDVALTQDKIRRAGLPAMLADRLASGK